MPGLHISEFSPLVMYNLLVLAALTAAIDLIVQGSWLSFHFLRDAMQGF